MRRSLLIVLFSGLGLLAVGSASASAESAALPAFGGIMSFGAIHGPSDPEEFSWEVTVPEEQELVYIDEQHAAFYYTEGQHQAGSITATPAHDGDGSSVPTSLRISEGDILTLIVHHRAGNPAAGGAPFVYPITQGVGWEGGFQTEVVIGPPDEMELREERERIQREEWEVIRRAGRRDAPLPRVATSPG